MISKVTYSSSSAKKEISILINVIDIMQYVANLILRSSLTNTNAEMKIL